MELRVGGVTLPKLDMRVRFPLPAFTQTVILKRLGSRDSEMIRSKLQGILQGMPPSDP